MVLKALSDSTEEGGIVLRASNNLLSSKGLSDGDPFFRVNYPEKAETRSSGTGRVRLDFKIRGFSGQKTRKKLKIQSGQL